MQTLILTILKGQQELLSIEICINSDGNYNTAFQNAVELIKHLMKELNIPLERVVWHYEASRKNSPASMSKNEWESLPSQNLCGKII